MTTTPEPGVNPDETERDQDAEQTGDTSKAVSDDVLIDPTEETDTPDGIYS